jgi:transposase
MIDEEGTVLAEWAVVHDGSGLGGLVERLLAEGGPEGVLVAVETGAPLMLDQLLGAGLTVYAINPKQADRFRDRLTAAGAKDDRRDAIVLAGAIRTDRQHLRPLTQDSDLCEEIRLRDRSRSRKITDRTRLSNQLREVLLRYFPGILGLKRDMYDPFFLSLLEAYPDPDSAVRSRKPRLQRLINDHRLRVLTAEDLQRQFRAPRPIVPGYVVDACRDEVLETVAQLRLLNEIIAAAETKLDELTKRHPDYELLMSLPGIGDRLAVRVVAELGDSRDRYPHASVLQATAGTAPVTRRSGKSVYSVRMRKGCNRTLQAALFIMARCSVRGSTWAAAFYEHQRAQGKRHPASVRALSNKWAKILWAVLSTRLPYDEAKHLERLRSREVPWCPAPEAAEAAA